LAKHKIWSVYIGTGGKYEGIVTKKDLDKKHNPSAPAFAIWSKGVFGIDQDADVEDAITLLKNKKVNQLAVTKNGIHCGIITQYDIRTRYLNVNIRTQETSLPERMNKSRDENSVVLNHKIPDNYKNGIQISTQKFSVFVSHINENRNIAFKFKDFIREYFSENLVDVFIAGDPDNIAFSDDWFEKIKDGIKDCNLMVILCTPESVKRPWINFEAGAATLLEKNVGPICFSGQKVGQLPSPLNYIRSQAIDCADDENFEQQISKFIKIISKNVGMPVPEIKVLDSEFYRAIKSEKAIKKPEESVSSDFSNNLSDKKIRVIQDMARTIFSPMQGLLEAENDHFKRGYNIELYYLNQLPESKNIRTVDLSPRSLLKKRIHDPDPILQKYLNDIQEMSDEYDTFSEQLEIINMTIIEKKDLFWDDFVKLCDSLNSPQGSLPNKEDYFTLFALTIADPKDLPRSYSMWDFYHLNRDVLRSFILKSPLAKNVREYVSLRQNFYVYSEHFLKVLTALKNDWIKTYLFLETDLLPSFL